MSDDARDFLRHLVTSTRNLSPVEMADRHEKAIAEIRKGFGHVALRDGEPLGGTVWSPKIRWHISGDLAHIFVDVRHLDQTGVGLEIEDSIAHLHLKRKLERVLEDQKLMETSETINRRIDLGRPIIVNDVKATVDNGVLHIQCPLVDLRGTPVSITWD